MSTGRPGISGWQLLLIAFVLSVCVTPFEIPAVLMPALGARDAWWGILPALPFALWGMAAAAALSRRFPGRPWDATIRAILGPYLGSAYLAAFGLLALGGVPACLLAFANAAHGALLPRLPVAFLAVMAAGVGIYAARCGLETIARCVEALLPLLAAGLAIIYAPMLFHSRFGFLRPLRPLAWSKWLSPQVVASTGTIRGFLPVLVLGPFAGRAQRWGRLALASSVGWVLVAGSLVLPVAIFDAPLAGRLNVAFLAGVGTIGWRWMPLRSLEGLTLVVWYGITFIVFSTYLWMATWILTRLLPGLSRDWSVLVLGGAAAALASLPLAEAVSHAMFVIWNSGVVLLGVVVPTVLCLLGTGDSSGRRTATAVEHPET